MSDESILDGYVTAWAYGGHEWRGWLVDDLAKNNPKMLARLLKALKLVTAIDLAQAIAK